MIKIKKPNEFKKLLPIGLILAALGFTLYPIAVSPMIDATQYKEIQKISRQGINQANIQPGDMKIWSDPFGRK